MAVADATHSAALLLMTRAAFVQGLDVMLAVCAVIALVSALLAVVFLPHRAAAVVPARRAAPAAGTAPEAADRADPAVPVGPAGPAAGDRSAAAVATGTRAGTIRAMSDTGTTDQPAGLRERKKAKSRATIRSTRCGCFAIRVTRAAARTASLFQSPWKLSVIRCLRSDSG